jgi:hypothetical protein
VGNAGDLLVFTIHEIAAAAGVAGEAVAAVPSDAYALARLPVGNVSTNGVDAAGNFVSGNTWILDAGPMAFFYERIAVADAAGFDLNPDLVAGGVWDVSFDEFEVTAGFGNLNNFHFRHRVFLMNTG